jgi:hypothetical protein
LISKKGHISSEEDKSELVDYSHRGLEFNTPSAALLFGTSCIEYLLIHSSIANVVFDQCFFCY